MCTRPGSARGSGQRSKIGHLRLHGGGRSGCGQYGRDREIAFQDRSACRRAGFLGRCLVSTARDARQKMVSKDHKLSLRRQCALLTLTRSNLDYPPKGESTEKLRFMAIIDKQFLETPWYGSRQMARYLQRQGHKCGRHRVRRLMRLMRLVPIYQAPNTSKKHPQHRIWPYLLRTVVIERSDQVWCADMTSIPLRRGFLYSVAIMDWYSCKVLAWRLSNTLEAELCVDALKEALAKHGASRRYSTSIRGANSPAQTGLMC